MIKIKFKDIVRLSSNVIIDNVDTDDKLLRLIRKELRDDIALQIENKKTELGKNNVIQFDDPTTSYEENGDQMTITLSGQFIFI